MLEVTGTVDKRLIAYCQRVYNYLNLDAIVDLSVVKSLRGWAQGYANGDEDWVQIDIARRDGERKLTRKRIMINIAHEMIHASQYNTKRMVNEGITVKDGELVAVVNWEGTKHIGTPYTEQPWEYEAYSMEEKVYEMCKQWLTSVNHSAIIDI